jgi:hypothetical protein
MSTTVKSSVNALTTARKAKKYGHVSLAYALFAVDPKSTLTGKDIAALEAAGAPAKDVAALVKKVNALPVKPGRFWDILEGRIVAPTKESAVFAGKVKKGTGPVAAVAQPSDLI